MTGHWLVWWSGQTDFSCRWIGVNARGEALSAVERGTLADAKHAIGDAPVIAVIPATHGFIPEVDCPAVADRQLKALIPFAIEDQLANDIATQHIIYKTHAQDASKAKVIVIAKPHMTALFDDFSEHGLMVSKVVLESDCLPTHVNQDLLVVRQGHVIFAPMNQPVVVLDIQPVTEAIEYATQSGGAAVTVVFEHSTVDTRQVIQELEKRYNHVTARESTQGLEAWLAPQILAPGSLNCATLEYKHLLTEPITVRRLLPLAVLSVLLLCLSLGFPLMQCISVHSAQLSLKQSVERLVQQRAMVLGSNNDLLALKSQLDEQVRLKESRLHQGLLGVLSGIRPIRQGTPSLEFDSIVLEGNHLKIAVHSQSAADIQRVNMQLLAQGYQRVDDNKNEAQASAHQYQMELP
jgi:type II secretion system protein L